ncbi:MAG: undecaprenyldiphospho-muramoylpentapeptide beta-N-acetylglucosaminyltransferase [Flavobacteriales bacterium]|jgi:UDP-N-acetylglucosamine--N-acetylmuramyl-(pentapeptide) pyrophosphoryl-undecaprenol N-acetylglucosamine transferase|nr:undecaprenyldiphospho-muramoylpentapeptide beta-N-acetylglucosaminyltransferase [Flavobacteriales bacterium]
MKQSVNILLSGGGTGGHIYPAIAIANELKRRHPKANFLFVGASNKMEMNKVPEAGYAIKGLWIAGLQRRLTFKNLMFPIKLMSSLLNARMIIKNFKPDVVIGTGGFASGPILQMATRKHIPTLIQEQNSYPGITNKILGKQVSKICVAYDGLEKYFPSSKIIKTGNPVRQDILETSSKRQEALTFFKLDKNKTTLLVLGGSLGAQAINKLVDARIDLFAKNNIQVVWQTGTDYKKQYHSFYQIKGIQSHLFIKRMDLAYAAADIIISRAGAGTISELCIVGKPVIFIPSPNVSEDHQTKNAQSLVDKNAAILIKESAIGHFDEIFENLVTDKNLQQELSTNIKQLALPNATKQIAETVELLLAV